MIAAAGHRVAACGTLVLAGLAACGARHEASAVDREAARALFDEVPLDSPPGMSDLTIDDGGRLWSVAERDRTVLAFELGAVPQVHPLVGIDAGLDTEAIGWLGPGKFVLGIEGAHVPLAGLAFAELRGRELVVTRTRTLSATELGGVVPAANHGIEAVCGRGDEVIAATETAVERDGARWAALIRLRGDTATSARLRLTSATGKISAIHCTLDGDGTAALVAIERHYGVCRILGATVRRDATEVVPDILLDLGGVLGGAVNLEGIARLPDGRLVAINDNQTRIVRGPTQLLVFRPR